MKVTTLVLLPAVEVEVEISAGEIIAAFSAVPGALTSMLKGAISNFAGFVKRVPDEHVRKMGPHALEITAAFYEGEAARCRRLMSDGK